MRPFILFFMLFLSITAWAQLPSSVEKMEGLWEYKEGSGFERWKFDGEILTGESFRVNLLGDTIVAERMEIKSINKRLVLSVKAYNIVDDSVRIVDKDFIGKKRKTEFAGISKMNTLSLEYKRPFFSRNKMYLIIRRSGIDKPKKLILFRQD